MRLHAFIPRPRDGLLDLANVEGEVWLCREPLSRWGFEEILLLRLLTGTCSACAVIPGMTAVVTTSDRFVFLLAMPNSTWSQYR